MVSQGRASGKAYRHEMDDAAHRAFALLAHGLKGMAVVSGYPCQLYDELFSAWERFERPSFADGARERTEVVWINAACAAALHRSRGGLFAEVA